MPRATEFNLIKKFSHVEDDHGQMDQNILFIKVVGEGIRSKLIKGAKTNLFTSRHSLFSESIKICFRIL